MKDINLINDKNQIDLNSLSNFLLDKEDDCLEVFLQIKGFKEINYISEFFFKRILPNNYFNKGLIPKELWYDYSFCEIAVSHEGNFLMNVSENIENYYSLCEKAVSQNGGALYHVPKNIQDYSLCEKAVLQNKNVIRFIKDPLIKQQIKEKFNLMEYISKEVKKLLKEYYLKEK
jgi:hypothetical protein